MSLTGNDSRLPFALIFSLRSHFGRSPALSVFTIIAIAASVALASALEMSTRSVQLEIERTADALFGAAQLEVAAGGMGIPEDLVTTVAETPGVLAASPLIDATFRLDGGPLDGQALHVLGVDFLSDRKVRGYEVTQRELAVSDPLRLLTQVNAVIVTQELADRLGLREGDVLPARWSGRPTELVIRGLLLPGGVADAYSGQVAAMDIYSLQEQLGRRGWIDRVDVVANEGVEVDALRDAIQARVAGRAQVRRSASRNEYADRVFGTVSLGVWIVAVIGALVAVFLSYSTMSISVDRRIRELALLQSAGLEGRRVRRLVRTDALVLSSIGTVLGLAVGLAISRFFFSVFSGLAGVVNRFQADTLQLTASTLIVAVSVGIVVGVLGSVAPSRRATADRPLEVLRERRRRARAATSTAQRVSVLIPLVAALTFRAMPGPPLLALAGFLISSVVFMITGTLFWFRPLLRWAQPLLDELLPSLGSFVGTSLLARPTQTALTASAIGSVVGGISGILITLESIEAPTTEYIASRFPNGVSITAGDPFGGVVGEELVSPVVADLIRSVPGIEALGESYNIRFLFRGTEVILVNRTMDLMLDRGRPPIVGQNPETVVAAMMRGEVAISEAFSRYFDFEVGDVLPLDTPDGQVEFRVAGLVKDYVGPAGSVHLDIRTFDKFWSRPGATALVYWPDNAELVDAIRDAVSDRQALFFVTAAEATEFMSRTLSGFVGLLYALAAMTSSLGALAILNLMLGTASERRREFGLLQSAGATSWHLAGIMLVDGLLLAGMGTIGGACLGIASATPMLSVVSDSLGWELTTLIDWAGLSAVAVLALATSAVAAAYGAVTTRMWRGVEVLSGV